MVKIRLTRMGAAHAPYYRVIVADSRSPRDGKFIDQIGAYNPLANPSEIVIDAEKAKKWLADGAIPTDTVKDLLVKAGVLPAPKKRAPAKTPKKKEEKK